MNKRFERLLSSFSRFLSNGLLELKLYQYWALAAFVLFGVLGIYPATKFIFNKISLVYEMQKINEDLSTKFSDLVQLEGILTETEEGAFYLKGYMPDNFDIQNYMVDFVIVAAQTGFLVDRFTPVDVSDNVTEISVTLSEEGDLPSFINLLESMGKVTEISKLTYIIERDTGRLRIVVNTFSMQK